MNRFIKEELQVKAIFIGVLLVLIALLIPLFWIGNYNFPSVDNVGYAKTAEVV